MEGGCRDLRRACSQRQDLGAEWVVPGDSLEDIPGGSHGGALGEGREILGKTSDHRTASGNQELRKWQMVPEGNSLSLLICLSLHSIT